MKIVDHFALIMSVGSVVRIDEKVDGGGWVEHVHDQVLGRCYD